MPTKQKVLLSDFNNQHGGVVNFGNEDEAASMTLMHLSSSLSSNPRPVATIKKGENSFSGVRTRSPSLRRATKKARMSMGSDSSESSESAESDEIIGCKCVKSSCLKLYCTCFQRGSYCLDTCGCVNCLNSADNDGPSGIRSKTVQEILQRRPDAFDNEPQPQGLQGTDLQLSLNPVLSTTNSSPTIALDQILSSDTSSSSSSSYREEEKKAPARRYRGAVKSKVGSNGCKCAKTRCLKLYCPCFEKGIVCHEGCICSNCHNTTEESGPDGIRTKTIEEILSRRPLAFDKREGDRNDVGCICKKTKCLKKYCICFSAGIYCDKDKCRCTDCGNRGDDSDNEEDAAINSNIDPAQGIKETHDETLQPFADLIELRCVDPEPPLMIEDPPLLDMVTLIEEV